jgi:fumarate reductase subunit C
VSDRYRSYTPSEPAEIRRKLLFGVALVLSVASVYAGLLEWGPFIQYGLAGLALLIVLIALASGASGPPGSAGATGGTPPSPGPSDPPA